MSNYKVEKEFEYRGYKCVVVGIKFGHRCGYVGVDKEHKLYGRDYSDLDIEVHGGLTYSRDGQYFDYPVESDLWWLGFDCTHAGDAMDEELIRELNADANIEGLEKMIEFNFDTFYGSVKTLEFCMKECKKIVDQII